SGGAEDNNRQDEENEPGHDCPSERTPSPSNRQVKSGQQGERLDQDRRGKHPARPHRLLLARPYDRPYAERQHGEVDLAVLDIIADEAEDEQGGDRKKDRRQASGAAEQNDRAADDELDQRPRVQNEPR